MTYHSDQFMISLLILFSNYHTPSVSWCPLPLLLTVVIHTLVVIRTKVLATAAQTSQTLASVNWQHLSEARRNIQSRGSARRERKDIFYLPNMFIIFQKTDNK